MTVSSISYKGIISELDCSGFYISGGGLRVEGHSKVPAFFRAAVVYEL